MCGIAGTIRIGDLAVVERMTALMAYRGPDDSGLYEDGEVCLGRRRLSILDLSAAGHQPMQATDGQLVITYRVHQRDAQAPQYEMASEGNPLTTRCGGNRPQVVCLVLRRRRLQAFWLAAK